MNIKNLEILKQGLEDNFDRIQYRFNMEQYRSVHTVSVFFPKSFKSKTDCGSHGCLLGHAPLLGIEELEALAGDFLHGSLDFQIYCERVFGIYDHNFIWKYLFASEWAGYDNTLQGSINRLDKVISGKVTEENAEEFLPWRRG